MELAPLDGEGQAVYVVVDILVMEITVAIGRPRAFAIDAALDHAMAVFWRKGYEGASIADLTAAMGINPPSLYAAFGNKERLFLKVIERYSDGPGGYLLDMLESPDAREAVSPGPSASCRSPRPPPAAPTTGG